MKHKREAENRSRRPAAGWLILLAVVIIAAVVCTAILVRKAPEQGEQPSAGPSAAEGLPCHFRRGEPVPLPPVRQGSRRHF